MVSVAEIGALFVYEALVSFGMAAAVAMAERETWGRRCYVQLSTLIIKRSRGQQGLVKVFQESSRLESISILWYWVENSRLRRFKARWESDYIQDLASSDYLHHKQAHKSMTNEHSDVLGIWTVEKPAAYIKKILRQPNGSDRIPDIWRSEQIFVGRWEDARAG